MTYDHQKETEYLWSLDKRDKSLESGEKVIHVFSLTFSLNQLNNK